MFTMAKIRNGATYLGQHLTQNDYYSEKETVAGQWQGKGATHLGLDGPICAGDSRFEALRANRHPFTGERLTCRDHGDRVCFFDFQCSAQKSVSILAVTLGDTRLLEAHEHSARRAFAELERFAATQANTPLTRANRLTGNLTAAVFLHTASRALDPQVHTHHVVANATWDEKTQAWRALTEFEMVKAIRYGGKVYQNELARECVRLGYEIEAQRDEKGSITGFEIAGVNEEIRVRFSKRRHEVEKGISEFRQKYGRDPSAAETHSITVATRSEKLAEITTPEVLAAQRAQLSASEWTQLSQIRRQAEDRVAEKTVEWSSRERESLRFAGHHVFERKSVSTGHAVLAEALNRNLGHIDLGRLKEVAAASALVKVGNEDWLHAPIVTEKGLQLEKWAIEQVEQSKGCFRPFASVQREDLPSLSDHQFSAVESLLASPDQVVLLRGAAGVGKSTIVRELQDLLQRARQSTYYCAPTASAAETLRSDGIQSATTVADFLQNISVRERPQLEGATFLVDEAGLASNQQGAAILRLAEACRARVIFLGDSRQHSAVEAGDFLRVLETHSSLHRVEVTEIRRQQREDYRAAVQLMAAGAVRAGMERFNDYGWIKEGQSNYLVDAVDAFMGLIKEGKPLQQVLAVAPTWEENHVFTDYLRERLKTLNVLGRGEPVVVHESLQWTKAQKQNPENFQPGMRVQLNSRVRGLSLSETHAVARVEAGKVWITTKSGERQLPLRSCSFDVLTSRTREICVGDRLLALANSRANRVINGEIVTVKSIKDGVLEADDGRRIDTAQFASFGYGYALTSHKSQSKTVDHVIVAASKLDAKSAYVACSRGRISCAVFTPDKERLFDRLPAGNREAAIEAIQARAPTQSPAKSLPIAERSERLKATREKRRLRLQRLLPLKELAAGVRSLWKGFWARAEVDAVLRGKTSPSERSSR